MKTFAVLASAVGADFSSGKGRTGHKGGADENLDQTEVEVSACIAMKNGKKQWNYISSMGIGQRQ